MNNPPESPMPIDPPFGKNMRRFYLLVAALTFYVMFWGFFFPGGLPLQLPGFAKSFDDALPFNLVIPPLHARFIGSFYGAATILLVYLALRARTWSDARICTWMIFIWTGILGIISFLHLEIFDWARPPWFAWMLAYIGFPLYAAWLLWQHRALPSLAADGTVAALLRAWFWVLAIALVPLSLALFFAPAAVAAAWPWKIPPILAQVYSGPLMAFGLCGALAARAGTWREVRGYVWVTLLFALGTLIASGIHRALFDPGRPVTWLWFLAFGATALILALWGAWPNRQRSATAPSP
jgi:hypothetical protein